MSLCACVFVYIQSLASLLLSFSVCSNQSIFVYINQSIHTHVTLCVCVCVCMCVCVCVLRFIFVHVYLSRFLNLFLFLSLSLAHICTPSVYISLSPRRCPWCSRYRRRKWTRRYEFKSWTILIAFHIALIPLGKVWIQLFSLQLWVNSRTD